MLRALPFVLAWKPLPEVLWQDSRDHFHILSHVRTNSSGAGGSKVPISGHLFSEDGLDWRFSPTEPYTNTIRYTDGTSRLFATLERPKLASGAACRMRELPRLAANNSYLAEVLLGSPGLRRWDVGWTL